MPAAHISNTPAVSALGMEPLLQGALTACHRLIEVVQVAFRGRPDAVQASMTPFQEAEKLRAFADEVLAQDPCFAQDLYAQADRHELANQA